MKNNKIIFTKWDPKGSRHRYFFQIFYRKYSWASRTLQLSVSLEILSDVSQVTKLKPSFEKRRENRSYLQTYLFNWKFIIRQRPFYRSIIFCQIYVCLSYLAEKIVKEFDAGILPRLMLVGFQKAFRENKLYSFVGKQKQINFLHI